MSGELEDPDALRLNNITYWFDDDLELNYLDISNKNEKAYVLTTDGYVEYSPIEIIQREKETIYDGLIIIPSYIRKMTNRTKSTMLNFLEKLKYPLNILMNNSLFEVCGNNVCIDKIENARYIKESNFFAESVYPELKVDNNLKISSDNEWITFDFSNVKRPAILSIQIDSNIYRKYFVDVDMLMIKIKKGTCFFDSEDEKVLCI